MLEYIILIWFTVIPKSTTFNDARFVSQFENGKMANVCISTDSTVVLNKWNTLSDEQKKTSRLFVGQEKKIETKIEPESKYPCCVDEKWRLK